MLHRHLTGNYINNMNYTALTRETFKGGMPKRIGQRGADSW